MHETRQPLNKYKNYEKAYATYTITRNNAYPITIKVEYRQHKLENIKFQQIHTENIENYTEQYDKITSIPPEIIIYNFLDVYQKEIRTIHPGTTREFNYDQTKWKITLHKLEIQEVTQDPPVARELKTLAKDLYSYCTSQGQTNLHGHDLADHIRNKIQLTNATVHIYYSTEQPETHLWIILTYQGLPFQNMPSIYTEELIETFGKGYTRKIPEAMIYEIRYNE